MKVVILESWRFFYTKISLKYRYTLTNITTYSRVHKMNKIQRSQISELESLGLEPTQINELNDDCEMANLISVIKQYMFLDYKCAYEKCNCP